MRGLIPPAGNLFDRIWPDGIAETPSEKIRFGSADRRPVYGRIERLLVGQGLVRRYVEKMTELSRRRLRG